MKRLTATVVLAVSLVAPAAHAEPEGTGVPGIRASIANVRFDERGAQRYFVAQQRFKNTRAQKAGAAFATGFLGMLGGAFVGGMFKECNCQDAGLKGALIGMPVGAAAGAVFGWWLASQ